MPPYRKTRPAQASPSLCPTADSARRFFHCGTLSRLNELGYLRQLDRISGVSGS